MFNPTWSGEIWGQNGPNNKIHEDLALPGRAAQVYQVTTNSLIKASYLHFCSHFIVCKSIHCELKGGKNPKIKGEIQHFPTAWLWPGVWEGLFPQGPHVPLLVWILRIHLGIDYKAPPSCPLRISKQLSCPACCLQPPLRSLTRCPGDVPLPGEGNASNIPRFPNNSSTLALSFRHFCTKSVN